MSSTAALAARIGGAPARSPRRRAALALGLSAALLAGLPGCDQNRLLGSRCAAPGCADEPRGLPEPVGGCGAQFKVARLDVRAGAELDHCELFTLDRLTAVGAHQHVYLTRAEVAVTPATQHLDVRLAAQVPGFDDGPVECSELWSRNVPWIPLMTAPGVAQVWDLSAAPLVTARSYRLLINHHVNNATQGNVSVELWLNLDCADAQPQVVSQAFEFSQLDVLRVGPGERRAISGSCNFDRAVRVSRLYRRTHRITGFSVQLEAEQPAAEPLSLWSSLGPEDWTRELEPALELTDGDDLRWTCEYDNMGDLPFDVGGTSSDACALLGLYQLPDGGEDGASPLRCTRFSGGI